MLFLRMMRSAPAVELFQEAFQGNPSLKAVFDRETPFGVFRYAGFNRRIAQFYNDEMGDPNGNKTMLLQDIAKDIFDPALYVNYYTEE